MTGPAAQTDPTTQSMIDAVTAATTVEDSAATLIATMAANLTAALASAQSLADLRAAVAGQVQALTTHTTPLVSAVTANTPAAPTS